MRHPLVGTLALGLSLTAGLGACGERERQSPHALVAGTQAAESGLLLREPIVPTFAGGGSPPPTEPIGGLDDRIANAFPEQVRGSNHPWTPTIVEFLASSSRSYQLRLEGEADATGRSALLWSETIEIVQAERCVLVFAVRRREPGSRDVALRRVLIRAREENGAWGVRDADVRDGAVPPEALPKAEDTDLHGVTSSLISGHLGVTPEGLPHALGVWLWLPPPATGTGRYIKVASSQPYQLLIDGTPYSAASSHGHAFWTLVLAPAPPGR